MEQMTLEDRIGVLLETNGLPVGQRCRRLQYPVVTREDLETRFGVIVLANKYNIMEKERVLIELAKSHGIPLEAAHRRFTVDIQNGQYEDAEVRDKAMMFDVNPDFNHWTHLSIMGLARPAKPSFIKTIAAKHCTGMVVIENLDHYMGDDIPPRVLDSLQVARECGLTDFRVAYPVIETKDVTVTRRQEHDPVLLAKLGEKLLEIDMWE